ncbi:MAG: lasso RiPP family leader peptide-containing protein [Egibacteraceae bacterium]
MRAYESPLVEVLGSVAELTQANLFGQHSDGGFPFDNTNNPPTS